MRRSSSVALLSAFTLAATLAVLTPGQGQAAPTASQAPAKAEPPGVPSQLRLPAAERLIPRYVVRDRDGVVHTRYDRTYRGLPVVGGDLVVHRTPSGRIGDVDWASHADLSAVGAVSPEVSKASAAAVAARSTGLRSTASDARLVVYAVGDRARLAWEATASHGLARSEVVYVDASNGRRITGWSLVHHADGTGQSLYSGRVRLKTVRQGGTFRLRDATRGNQRVLNSHHTVNIPPTGTLFADADNQWGNGQPSGVQSAAVDAHYGAAKTWDYYESRFNRNGIRGDGVGARSFVHYGNNVDNAFWRDDCFCMVYGDGGRMFRPLVSLDVVGHEMSHGVMSHTAALIYFGESGGLNEANSDIHGAMVEFFANNRRDRGDYRIGEKIAKGSPPYLRRMDNPRLDGFSYNCWNPLIGADDVHFTSGPANHWFYLLSEGSGPKTINGMPHNSPTCNGSNLNGIGRIPAARIWYHAVSIYMTSTTNYRVARDATIRAARDIFGANSSQCQRVASAWNAVSVPANDWSCTGTPPAQGTNVVANPGFESGNNGDWDVTGTLITANATRCPSRTRATGSRSCRGTARTSTTRWTSRSRCRTHRP
ncbi:MAG: M4 family metallopeptidase [Nocardioidaceae bacterium]